jgi:hypothetical protein
METDSSLISSLTYIKDSSPLGSHYLKASNELYVVELFVPVLCGLSGLVGSFLKSDD